MKTIAAVVGVAGVVGGILYFGQAQPIVVQNELISATSTPAVVDTRSPEEIAWDEEGEKLKQEFIANEKRKVELSEIESQIEALEVEAQALRKEISAY